MVEIEENAPHRHVTAFLPYLIRKLAVSRTLCYSNIYTILSVDMSKSDATISETGFVLGAMPSFKKFTMTAINP
jgi:hypothetical protein